MVIRGDFLKDAVRDLTAGRAGVNAQETGASENQQQQQPENTEARAKPMRDVSAGCDTQPTIRDVGLAAKNAFTSRCTVTLLCGASGLILGPWEARAE
jgi:hypothetical protein